MSEKTLKKNSDKVSAGNSLQQSARQPTSQSSIQLKDKNDEEGQYTIQTIDSRTGTREGNEYYIELEEGKYSKGKLNELILRTHTDMSKDISNRKGSVLHGQKVRVTKDGGGNFWSHVIELEPPEGENAEQGWVLNKFLTTRKKIELPKPKVETPKKEEPKELPKTSEPPTAISREKELAQKIYNELHSFIADDKKIIEWIRSIDSNNGLDKLLNSYNSISPDENLKSAINNCKSFTDNTKHKIFESMMGIDVDKLELMGNTNESSYFTLRSKPSTDAPKLGELKGKKMDVTVKGKGVFPGSVISDTVIFYKVQFKNPSEYAQLVKGNSIPDSDIESQSLLSNSEAWVTGDGLVLHTTMEVFMSQLRNFEKIHSNYTLKERITKIRQMCHPRDLPFDSIIGTVGGNYYNDDRPDLSTFYQILKDAQAIVTPNGEVIDIYHFIVGLDAYQDSRRKEKSSVSFYFVTNPDVGNSHSASTWAGDIGAAAGDLLLNKDKPYEKEHTDLQNHYYRTRASDQDLLADIDAWGAYKQTEDTGASIESIIENYYGVQKKGATEFKEKRKTAIQNFIQVYGLIVKGGSLLQNENRSQIVSQIYKFAYVWYQKGSLTLSLNNAQEDVLKMYSEFMGDKFLNWLNELAKKNGAI